MSSRAHDERLRAASSVDPDAAREQALELVREHTQSSVAVFFRFGMVGGEPLPTSWMVRGVDESFVRRRLEERIVWPHADPRLPDRRWNGRFLTQRHVLDPETQLWPSRLYERCHAPAGVHDFLRMLVYHGGACIGWIGALRTRGEPPFTTTDVRRVAPLAPALTDALVCADAAERAGAPEGGSDLVLRPDGSIELASPRTRGLLLANGACEELRRFARSIDATGSGPELVLGQRVRWARLTGAVGVRYLLHLDAVPPAVLHPGHVLSRAQRDVATLAAAGATVEEIARATGITRATVRTHLRVTYERLGVSSRAELVHVLDGAPATPGLRGPSCQSAFDEEPTGMRPRLPVSQHATRRAP